MLLCCMCVSVFPQQLLTQASTKKAFSVSVLPRLFVLPHRGHSDPSAQLDRQASVRRNTCQTHTQICLCCWPLSTNKHQGFKKKSYENVYVQLCKQVPTLCCCFLWCPGMTEREKQVMMKLKEVVDKQRDEIRAKDRELTLKNEDIEAVRPRPLCLSSRSCQLLKLGEGGHFRSIIRTVINNGKSHLILRRSMFISIVHNISKKIFTRKQRKKNI